MPPRDLQQIADVEQALLFPAFDADIVWALGTRLRERLSAFPQPVVINIARNATHVLFHTVTRNGTAPDNDLWVMRKRNTVLRWGFSTWYMHNKLAGDEAAFAKKYSLGDRAGEYAIHGGGFPIRVRGVDGVVAVVVVSGLKQEQDHQIIVDEITEFLAVLKQGQDGISKMMMQ